MLSVAVVHANGEALSPAPIAAVRALAHEALDSADDEVSVHHETGWALIRRGDGTLAWMDLAGNALDVPERVLADVAEDEVEKAFVALAKGQFEIIEQLAWRTDDGTLDNGRTPETLLGISPTTRKRTEDPTRRVLDRALKKHAVEALDAAGFQKDRRNRRWRRIGTDRVDLIEFERRERISLWAVIASTYVPALDVLLGDPPIALDRVVAGQFSLAVEELTDDSILADSDLGAAVDGLVRDLIDRFEATTHDDLLNLDWQRNSIYAPLLLEHAGRHGEAIERLRQLSPEPSPFDDPDRAQPPVLVRVSNALGVDPESLRRVPDAGWIDARAIKARLQERFGTQLLWCAPTREHLAITLLRPTDQELEDARTITAIPAALIELRSVTHSVPELLALARELNPYLDERMQELPAIYAAVRSVSEGEFRIEVWQLDDVTRAGIEARVPASVLIYEPLDAPPD